MPGHSTHLSSAATTSTSRTLLHGPISTGPIEALKIPQLPERLDPKLLLQCLRFMVQNGRLPTPSDFFQPNRPKNLLRNTARFGVVSVFIFTPVLVFGALFATIGLISGGSAFFGAGVAAILVTILSTRRRSKSRSMARKLLRDQWGFSVESKVSNLAALEAVAAAAPSLFYGLSAKIAERHRWTFDLNSVEARDRAAAYVERALTFGDDISQDDPDQPIDRGNIQRFCDTGLAILTATEQKLASADNNHFA